MNNIIPEIKILKLSYYLLGKTIFKTCVKQKVTPIIFQEFCNSQKCSDAFRLKYLNGLTVEKIAEQLNYDVRSIYKRFDRDMYTFGRWLTQDCSNANTFKNMKNQLEMEICIEYNKRKIITTDNKAWNKLRSDCLKKLSQRINDSINNIIIK